MSFYVFVGAPPGRDPRRAPVKKVKIDSISRKIENLVSDSISHKSENLVSDSISQKSLKKCKP